MFLWSFMTWIMFLYISRSKTEFRRVIFFHGGATTIFYDHVILNIMHSPLILHSLLAIVPSLCNRYFWNIYLCLFSYSLHILICCFNFFLINTSTLKLVLLKSMTSKSLFYSFSLRSFLSLTSFSSIQFSLSVMSDSFFSQIQRKWNHYLWNISVLSCSLQFYSE